MKEKVGRKMSVRKYTRDDLARAVEFFASSEKDFSMAFVAKLFNIPDKTLSDNIKKRKREKLTDPTIPSLNHSTSLEMDIMKGINLASQNGWVLSEDIIMEGVHTYCSEKNPLLMKLFPHSDLQKQWAHNFYMQYKNEVTLIEEESLHPLTEEKNCSEHLKKMFFKLLYKKLINLGVMNNNRKIFVVTEFCLETVDNCKEKSYNALLCCNAAGEFLSPNVIYKDSQSSQCNFEIRGGTLNKCFTSKSGYLDDKTFELWLKNQFLPYLCESKIRLPVILIIDGHGSRMTYNLVQRAEALEVTLMCLPPHSTNELHPFSLGILQWLKMNWLEIRTTFYQRSKLREISEFTFPLLLKLLYTKLISNRESVVNGFAACGLCPFNENIMDEQDSSLQNTFQGNEAVNIRKSGRDLKTNICHGSNKNLCDGKTPALKHTKRIMKSCKKSTNSSQKLRRSSKYSQDSQNLKKTKNVQKCKISHKESGKSLQNSTKMLQKYVSSPKIAQPKPEESLQKSEDFQQPVFEFIQVDIKHEEKIFSEPESEIILPLDKLGDFPSEYTNSLDNFKESLRKLEKIYNLKKCFIPLVNIIGKKNISSSESSFPKKEDSLQQTIEDFSKNIVPASCDLIKQELDFSGLQGETLKDINISAIKEERELDFIDMSTIKEEIDGEFYEFPTADFDDEQNDTKEAIILGLNNTSKLEENYELNLFPMFVNDLPEKRSDTETLVNNHHSIGCSIFLNNWNNETRKELQKVRLKLQLSNQSECEKELRGVYKEKRLKRNTVAQKRRRKSKTAFVRVKKRRNTL